MNKGETDIFKSKVSLIYEFNKSSPLFARMAKIQMDENNLERATEILNNGLKMYPNYPTAYFILGKALTLAGKYNDAKKAFEEGSRLINSKKTFEYYLLELENLRKHRPLFEFSKKNPFMPESDIISISKPDDQTIIRNQQPGRNDEDVFNENINKQTQEDFSEELEQKERGSGHPNADSNDYSEDDMIVSETIAKIYIAQGEFKEAIKVYEKLKKNDPSQIDYYSKRISEINSKLNG